MAHQLGIDKVVLADNGIASINLPINPQVLSALATRSTHPKFIALLNRLLENIFGDAPSVVNTLSLRTRAEAMDTLRRVDVPELLQESVSCPHTRGRPAVQPHCGVCSQCIDRRFASASRGLDDHDLPERYETDVLRDPLHKDKARAMALSYVSFARVINTTSEDQFFDEFPQLFDCILPDDADPERTARDYVQLLKRHSDDVLRVLRRQAETRTAEIAEGTIAPDSLLALAIAPKETAGGEFRASPDFRSVRWRGTLYHLTDKQAQVIQILFDAFENGTPEVGQAYLLEKADASVSRLRGLFGRAPLWKDRMIVSGDSKGTYRLNVG